MKTNFSPEKYSKELITQLSDGAFLTVKNKNKVNTMTIGWGQIGIMWAKPVLVVPVRLSRHTHDMLDETDEFTVCVPRHSEMLKELSYCGTNSGRDVNKIEKTRLLLENSKLLDTPVIKQCKYHFECKIISRVPLDKNNFTVDFDKKYYKNSDYHELFYGEIIASYTMG